MERNKYNPNRDPRDNEPRRRGKDSHIPDDFIDFPDTNLISDAELFEDDDPQYTPRSSRGYEQDHGEVRHVSPYLRDYGHQPEYEDEEVQYSPYLEGEEAEPLYQGKQNYYAQHPNEYYEDQYDRREKTYSQSKITRRTLLKIGAGAGVALLTIGGTIKLIETISKPKDSDILLFDPGTGAINTNVANKEEVNVKSNLAETPGVVRLNEANLKAEYQKVLEYRGTYPDITKDTLLVPEYMMPFPEEIRKMIELSKYRNNKIIQQWPSLPEGLFLLSKKYRLNNLVIPADVVMGVTVIESGFGDDPSYAFLANKNPGDTRKSKSAVKNPTPFTIYPSWAAGYEAIYWEWKDGGLYLPKTQTLKEMYNVWAPTEDNNDPNNGARVIHRWALQCRKVMLQIRRSKIEDEAQKQNIDNAIKRIDERAKTA